MRPLIRLLALSSVLLGSLQPLAAHAWWNEAYSARVKLVLNTSTTGVETKDAATQLPVAVRLHSGNFDFLAAKADGADLRVVAGDDKTPLKFHVERFDGSNELGLLWVVLPTLAPGSDKNTVYVYYGNAAATSEAGQPAASYDPSYAAVLQFGEKGAPPRDHSGSLGAAAVVPVDVNGLLGQAAKLDGQASVDLPASDRLKFATGSALSVSAWVKPATAPATGTLYQQGPLALQIADGKLVARIGSTTLTAPAALTAAWTPVALTVGGGKALLYANGALVAQTDVVLPETTGPVRLGAGFVGLLDEVEVASTVRSAEWLRLAAAAQGAEGKLLAATRETRDQAEAEGGGHNYFGILVKNLTTDAWVVIIILALMFVIAAWVMVSKTLLVGRLDRGNRHFLGRFRDAGDHLLGLDQGAAHGDSSLFRLYQAGLRELRKRNDGQGRPGGDKGLSGASIDAIKASIDADLVRESHKLNSQMVLLTIAISGGPFLGLLGTVVGVMITFAAIAAAGDVNVNAIAPGIAAALLATVAGLGVAIPALFGYNYLAARIKNISADMQIFVDEFVTRVAELHGAR